MCKLAAVANRGCPSVDCRKFNIILQFKEAQAFGRTQAGRGNVHSCVSISSLSEPPGDFPGDDLDSLIPEPEQRKGRYSYLD